MQEFLDSMPLNLFLMMTDLDFLMALSNVSLSEVNPRQPLVFFFVLRKNRLKFNSIFVISAKKIS